MDFDYLLAQDIILEFCGIYDIECIVSVLNSVS